MVRVFETKGWSALWGQLSQSYFPVMNISCSWFPSNQFIPVVSSIHNKPPVGRCHHKEQRPKRSKEPMKRQTLTSIWIQADLLII